MSTNAIPSAEKPLLALAEDCADGCATHEDEVGLKQTREEDLRALIAALKGDTTTTPPTAGLIIQHKQAELDRATAETARGAKDAEVKAYLTQARKNLTRFLGDAPSAEWALAGFSSPQGNSNKVPGTQDERLQCLSMLAVYLNGHPTYTVAAGGPAPEITVARTQALHTQLSDARQVANDAKEIQQTAFNAKNEGLKNLRLRLISLVAELKLLLGGSDTRWEVFGLNVPDNPSPPGPASDLVLTPVGPDRLYATWTRGARSNNDKIYIMVEGADLEYRYIGKSGGDSEEMIKDLAPERLIKVKIIAVNGSLEAPSGPEAEIVLPP